jgi:AraC-like DNA-binding protein
VTGAGGFNAKSQSSKVAKSFDHEIGFPSPPQDGCPNGLFAVANRGHETHESRLAGQVDEARRLLRETKKSVVEVALDVGYANPSHFAQLFRRETGLSPSDYHRQR